MGSDARGSHVALDEFTTFVPPGWRPGIKGYSFRAYSEKLRLWWRIRAQEDDGKAAALIVSRLQGTPYKMAMALRITRDGIVYDGDNAIVLPAVAAGTIDPLTGNALEEQPSGLQVILGKLRVEHRLHDHDEQQELMDAFFDLKQHNRDLTTFITDFEFAYDEASARAGLEINSSGRTALLFRKSSLTKRMIDDVLLKVDGDSSRYADIVAILRRIGKREQATSSSSSHYIHDADDEIDYDDQYHDELLARRRRLV